MSEIEKNSLKSNSEPSLTTYDGSSNNKKDIEDSTRVEEAQKNTNSTTSVTEPKKITIEDASEEIHSITPPSGSFKSSLEEQRKTYKTRISGHLAQLLWWLLGGVVVLHLLATIGFSACLIKKPASDDKEQYIERIKTAILSINEASKTLYTFLGPLATVVTGFYFAENNNNSKDD